MYESGYITNTDGLMGYGEDYHLLKFSHLHNNPKLYHALAQISRLKDFDSEDIGKRILDYGCGTGVRIAAMPNAEGYDISDAAAKFCQSKGLSVSTKLKPEWKEAFDIVIISQVLEHVPSPFDTLKEIRGLLKPGGKIIVEVPQEFNLKVDNLTKEDTDQHFFAWNFKSLNNLLKAAGFQPEKNQHLPVPSGCKLCMPLTNFDMRLYHFATQVGGKVLGEYDLRVVARKS